MHLFWSQKSLCGLICTQHYRLCPHVLNWRVYTIELHRHDSEFPVLKIPWQWRSVFVVCESFLLNKWVEMIITLHSNTKRGPWKSERESVFFWIVPFMVCYLYVWMASTRAVTCTSAVDKWLTMYPSVFIVALVHLFPFFAFIVTIQLTLLLGYQVWG